MNRRRIPALALASLLPFSLAACGGDVDAAGAPKDASEKDFCSSWNDDMGVGEDADVDELVDGMRDGAADLAKVGTPKDIDKDLRSGFELFIDALADIDEDGVKAFQTASEPEDLGKALDLSGDDADNVFGFITWAEVTCG